MAEMNNNTADLLQQLIDIKDDIRGSIQYKGVNVVGGMIDYPYAIDRIRQDGSTYTYKIPTADVNGLEAIGWDNESIKYYADNNLQYDGLSDYFKVSEENKALYGVVNEEFFRRRNEYGQPIQDLNLQYCPYFDITDATSLFQEQFQIKGVPLFDTSSITDMSQMFLGCIGLITVPPLNTSSVTNMRTMFGSCYNLNNIPLFDTSSVTNMSGMFRDCYVLASIPQLDTSKVTDMSYMFYGCNSLISIPLLDTSSVTNMDALFGSSGYYGSDVITLTNLGGFKDLKISITSHFLDYAPNLTVESLMNVINNLYDLTANGVSGKTLKFGTDNLIKLTDEQIAVATNKGWTLV